MYNGDSSDSSEKKHPNLESIKQMLKPKNESLKDNISQQIISFSDLYKHHSYEFLCQAQAFFDDKENQNTTRSPIHMIAFLICYSAATNKNKRSIAEKLLKNHTQNSSRYSDSNVLVEELDGLTKAIEWNTLLDKNREGQNTVDISCVISVPNLNEFKGELPKQLRKALKNKNSFISLEKNKEGVIKIVTSLKQSSDWVAPLNSSAKGGYWKVPDRTYSLKKFNSIIGEMKKSDTIKIGCFEIIKGDPEGKIEVYIKKNQDNSDHVYSVNDVNKTTGVYQYFIGLESYAGLSKVDGVLVELKNKAEFSCKGIKAFSEQTVLEYKESAVTNKPQPTKIYVEDISSLIEGIDIYVNFSKKQLEDCTNDVSIQLKCTDENNVILYPSNLSNQKALSIFLANTKKSINFGICKKVNKKGNLAYNQYCYISTFILGIIGIMSILFFNSYLYISDYSHNGFQTNHITDYFKMISIVAALVGIIALIWIGMKCYKQGKSTKISVSDTSYYLIGGFLMASYGAFNFVIDLMSAKSLIVDGGGKFHISTMVNTSTITHLSMMLIAGLFLIGLYIYKKWNETKDNKQVEGFSPGKRVML